MRLLAMLVLAAALGLVFAPGASAIRFTDESFFVPQGVVGRDYGHQFEGEGGCGPLLPYQFRVLSGELPPGLSLRSDGLLVGIPRQAGSWSFWLELSDEDPPSEPWCFPRKSERRFTVDIVAGFVVTTASAPPGTVGTPYSLPLKAEGGGTGTWSVASGQLPPGLTLNSSTGMLAGTPTAAGAYQFRVRVSDDSRSASKQFTVLVRQPLAVQAPTVPAAEVGVRMVAVRLGSTGGFGAKAWRLEGSLPRGLTFDAANGAITGTPAVAGSFPVSAVVGDSEGRSAVTDLTIVVSPRLTITSTRLAPAATGRAYRAKVSVRGGVGATRFRILTGRLPAGVRLDPRTGTLIGTPRTAGSYRIMIEARDSLGATAQRTYVLTVRRQVDRRR
jgi:large repetitive protein